jgi:AmmeMemoRadiSam system protein B
VNNLSTICPKIRLLDFQPMTHQGEQVWLVCDPREITPAQLVLPVVLAQMTIYCDGQHDIPAIYAALARDFGGELSQGILESALEALDEAYMLENERFRQKYNDVVADFRKADCRPMTLVGLNYSKDITELCEQFESYSFGDDPADLGRWSDWQGRGIVSPHIDYQRGGEVYAKTWTRSKNAVAEADLVLMFATDHKGGLGSLTLTDKPYETPYGILPTDLNLVHKLAESIGQQDAYRLELNHRREHSVELSAVWLHHIANQVRPGNPPPMIPLLIGSFQHFVNGDGHPAKDKNMVGFIEALKAATAGKRVLCVASVDLSHVGPAFGDDYVMDQAHRDELTRVDEGLIEAVKFGDEERFYAEIANLQNRNKVCGFSPLYLMLQFLGETSGTRIAYEHCPADAEDQSLVSICGLLLD